MESQGNTHLGCESPSQHIYPFIPLGWSTRSLLGRGGVAREPMVPGEPLLSEPSAQAWLLP